ncbi:MAG: radical SAM protein, partial [bacterium]
MATFSREQRHGRLDDHGRSQTDFFRTHGYAPAPLLVQALITYDCPLRCSHCLAGGCDTNETIMPLSLFESVAQQVASLNVPELLLTGGEPLSHPEMPAIIESLRKHHISWTLNTAAMPDKAAKKAMESCPPSFVAVSLDGPALVHDSFRGLNGSHEAALESIHYFSGLADYGVAAGTTVTTMNFPYLEETFNIVLASGASSWGIHLLVPEGRARTRTD